MGDYGHMPLERPMRLIELFWKNERGTMLADVAKAGAAIALLSVIATNIVSTQTTAHLDTERLSQIASAASKGERFDPLVTGSILKRAGETKLDPCVLPR